MNEWIPISESLPKAYGDYLLTVQSKNGVRYVVEGEWTSVVDFDFEGNSLDTAHNCFVTFYAPGAGMSYGQEIPMECIVAWMRKPRPRPYYGETEWW